MRVFHSTLDEAADEIDRAGFHDLTGTGRIVRVGMVGGQFMGQEPWKGVWVADGPVSSALGDVTEALFIIEIAEEEIASYEHFWVFGQLYREWLVPAHILNEYPRERHYYWDWMDSEEWEWHRKYWDDDYLLEQQWGPGEQEQDSTVWQGKYEPDPPKGWFDRWGFQFILVTGFVAFDGLILGFQFLRGFFGVVAFYLFAVFVSFVWQAVAEKLERDREH